MDVKERRPYCSLTKSRRDKDRRYTDSVDSEGCRVPTQKSYSSSETLKAFDHDSSRLLYENRVKEMVHMEAEEYTRQAGTTNSVTLIDQYRERKPYFLVPIGTTMSITLTGNQKFSELKIKISE
ncbi:UNVERIFIED_CONTAM: hypothetical protein FKN15_001373 [Acipenser sinensis]